MTDLSYNAPFPLHRQFSAPPVELLTSKKYEQLVEFIRQLLKSHRIDTICLSVPFTTLTDRWLTYFLSKEIIPHIEIDRAEPQRLTQVYIGETNLLERASKSPFASRQ